MVNFSLDRYPAELAEWRAAAGVFAPAPARRSVRGLPLRPDYLPMDHVVVAAAVAAVTGTAGAVAAQPVTDSLHPGEAAPQPAPVTCSFQQRSGADHAGAEGGLCLGVLAALDGLRPRFLSTSA